MATLGVCPHTSCKVSCYIISPAYHPAMIRCVPHLLNATIVMPKLFLLVEIPIARSARLRWDTSTGQMKWTQIHLLMIKPNQIRILIIWIYSSMKSNLHTHTHSAYTYIIIYNYTLFATHTHTHIYIYIMSYILCVRPFSVRPRVEWVLASHSLQSIESSCCWLIHVGWIVIPYWRGVENVEQDLRISKMCFSY